MEPSAAPQGTEEGLVRQMPLSPDGVSEMGRRHTNRVPTQAVAPAEKCVAQVDTRKLLQQ